MLISAYFPLKKVGGNRKSEEKAHLKAKKVSENCVIRKTPEPRRGAAGKSLKKLRRGLT